MAKRQNSFDVASVPLNSQTGCVMTINSSNDTLGIAGGIVTAPASSSTATTAFGSSLTSGNAVQNTLGYDVLVNISWKIALATGAILQLGIGPTSSPTLSSVTGTFTTLSALAPIVMTAIVPSNYYLLVDTTGVITITSITTQVCPL